MADRWIATNKWIRPVANIEEVVLHSKAGGVSIKFRDKANVDLYNADELGMMLRHFEIKPTDTAIGVTSSLCLEMLVHVLAGTKRVIRFDDLFDKLVSSANKDIVKLVNDIESGKLDRPLSGVLQYILLKHNSLESSVKAKSRH